MKKAGLILLLILAVHIKVNAQDYTFIIDPGDPGADFTSLEEAFSLINNSGTDIGVVHLQIAGSTIETSTAILYESGYGGSYYTSVLIYPTSSGLSISGNINGPLIQLNSAANVTFDGRVNQAGAADLTITNTSTGTTASTILFTESANNNVVQYCIIKGAGTGTSYGTIFFSTSAVGTGNDDNTITNNFITASAGRPINSLFSYGTSGSENDGNIISNNEFYNFLNLANSSNGIYLSEYSSAFTISGNSFYETSTLSPSASTAYYIIRISTTNGNDFTVSGNYIGGNDAACSGTWVKAGTADNIFSGIYISTGSGTASSLQNNRIQNIEWDNASNAVWQGIEAAAGDINIGTSSGNYIGNSTGTGSIQITNDASGSVYGINITGSGAVSCQNNNIGSITTVNTTSTTGVVLSCIFKSSSSGTTNISGNIIGSVATTNSVLASSISTGYNQIVIGIYNNGTGDITISNNTVANLNNAGTRSLTLGTGRVIAIYSIAGTNTISDNIIHDITHANGNTTSGATPSVCGISMGGSGTTLRTISGNTIYNLSNTRADFAGSVIGIYIIGNTGENMVSGNFIHNLAVTGASSNAASLIGIKLAGGTINTTNNIVSLGGNTKTNVYGIYGSGGSGNINRIYFNTVFIGGTVSSGTNKSYAFYNLNNLSTRNIRNNVFVNKRSTALSSSLHYAAGFAVSGGTITCDYNDYFVSGTGGVLGFYGADVASLPIVTSQDANSYSIDPQIASEGSTADTDYTIGQDLIGVDGTGITTDYNSDPRYNPTMGAWERLVNKWIGTTSTAWNVTTNWTGNALPLENASIFFDAAAVNDLYLNADHSVNNITNPTSLDIVTNGYQLSVRGAFDFTGTGLVDATASSSTVLFSGLSAQQINAADFVSGKAYNITIDNTPGVTLESDFLIDNALTINTGKKLVISAGTQLTVTGTLTNNAGNSGLVIRSTSSGNDGKLVNNSAGVPATVKLFISGGAGVSGPAFHYVTPPVASMSIDNSSVAATAASLGLTYFNGDLILYDETKAIANKNAGWQYFDGYGGTTGFSSLVSSRGYNIYLTQGDSITFTGNLNGSAHSFNLSYTGTNPDPGWNLVGNPYPCNYDLNGIPELTASGDDVDNTIYFNNDGGYAYWNPITGGTSGYSDILPPMQGFFVHVLSSGKTLNLPTTSKTGSAALPLRSKGASYEIKEAFMTVKKIKLALSKGSQKDETIVALIDDATPVFDSDYDAFKLFANGSTSPSLYSEMGATKYAINAIREAEGEQTIIPLRVIIKTAGEHKIEIPEFENIGGTKVVLKHGSDETLLSEGTTYTFTSPVGTFTDFELLIGEESITTDVEDLPEVKFKAWHNNDFIYINAPSDLASGKGRMNIYDMQGRSVYNDSQLYLVAGETIQVPVNLPTGIYVIHVNINNRTFVSKVVVM